MPRTTGQQYDIGASGYSATVTEVGAGLRELRYGTLPLITSFGADEVPQGAQGQLLIPWPNRIDEGRYDFDGETHRLQITEPDRNTAIHGLTRWQPWELVEHIDDQVTLRYVLENQPGYPFRLELIAEYFLSPDGLMVTVTATNIEQRTAPYANGAHPYLTLDGNPIDAALLTVVAEEWLPTDERKIPRGGTQPVADTDYDFRRPRTIGDLEIDYAFTKLRREPDNRSWVRLSDSQSGAEIGLWVDDHYPWIEIFTGDELPEVQRRRGLGVEPMTCPPNGFATGEGVIALQPSESVTTSWGIRVIALEQGAAV